HMIHESAYGKQGKASDHAEQVGMNIKLESQLWSSYEQAMLAHRDLFYGDDPNWPVLRARIRHFLMTQCKGRDTYLSAHEAQKYGLLHFVIPSNTDLAQYYDAMEIYMGLRHPDHENRAADQKLCTLFLGQSQPFVFD